MRLRFGSMLLVGAVVLGGCGSSGPTDKQQIAAIVKREGSKPATLCNSLTDSMLATVGGRSGCLRQAGLAAPDSSTHASSIRVHGNSASAVVVDRQGSRMINFVKRKGAWKVSGVS